MNNERISDVLTTVGIANTVSTFSQLKDLIFNCYNEHPEIIELRKHVTTQHFVSALNWLYMQRDFKSSERVYPEVKRHIYINLT